MLFEYKILTFLHFFSKDIFALLYFVFLLYNTLVKKYFGAFLRVRVIFLKCCQALHSISHYICERSIAVQTVLKTIL